MPPLSLDFVDAVFQPGAPQTWLETEVLPEYFARSRWFAGKARQPQKFSIVTLLSFELGIRIPIVRVDYAEGAAEIYQVPMRCLERAAAPEWLKTTPSALITEAGEFLLVDALYDAEFRAQLWFRLTKTIADEPESRVLEVEQSNSSLLYGGKVFVKIIRKPSGGINPEAEILKFLTERTSFRQVPTFVGSHQFIDNAGARNLLAVAVSAVPNRGDAWSFVRSELAAYYRRVAGQPSVPAQHSEMIGQEFLARIAQLGTRTGELHLALASDSTDPDFSPEPLTPEDLSAMGNAIVAAWQAVAPALPLLADLAPHVEQTAQALATQPIVATRIRTHGDYHLGQVLETGDDFVIIDFEGEPARSLIERRRKQSPLRDVAGMLRSFDYAAQSVLREAEGDASALTPWADAWTEIVSQTFLEAWQRTTNGSSIRPATNAQFDHLLRGFLVEKALYEIAYELNHRPTWLPIPRCGLERLLRPAATPPAPAA